LIVGIWALILLPVWITKNDAGRDLKQVDNFRKTMATLRDDRVMIPAKAPKPMVYSKRAVKVGGMRPEAQRLLATRRRVFAVVLVSVPATLIFVLLGIAPVYMALTPLVAFALYVGWVQGSRKQSLKPRSQTEDHSEDRGTQREQSRRSQRTHLLASFASIRRAATQRLLAAEPELDTAETVSWQPAHTSTNTWSIPETVLPTYVNAPAATETPRNIDVEHGTWDGAAMVQAASQQRKQDLADIVAELQIAAPKKIAFDDEIDNTTELEVFKGA
jgi:type II secretory pathway pseudopilin PulG